MMRVQSHNPFQRTQPRDPKRVLLRRADTERDTAFTVGGKARSALHERRPITLPRVRFLEKPDPGDD
jgi:hypothetical protein